MPWYQHELNWNHGCAFSCSGLLCNTVWCETFSFCSSILLILAHALPGVLYSLVLLHAVRFSLGLCRLNFILWISTVSFHFFNMLYFQSCLPKSLQSCPDCFLHFFFFFRKINPKLKQNSFVLIN